MIYKKKLITFGNLLHSMQLKKFQLKTYFSNLSAHSLASTAALISDSAFTPNTKHTHKVDTAISTDSFCIFTEQKWTSLGRLLRAFILPTFDLNWTCFEYGWFVCAAVRGSLAKSLFDCVIDWLRSVDLSNLVPGQRASN